ncbi:TlpA family protein disulfide reductase [Pararcticibacter amylolyticus]|uniref:Thioredoxin domain-containing protein n=1 Tax=Pararcticibacter amylolyticus TaxID=2173175 RepID=A0A2U2PDV3_9SPHI|nr:TlpA disulfide reductase family protein [Pararcticibacter amylolyticus]PWG79566.1 hypothetical protein DDR33_15980 [Pararcticibacter amylolyticus]
MKTLNSALSRHPTGRICSRRFLLALLLLFVWGIRTNAQFRLYGKLPGGSRSDTLYLNIPFVYGNYRENDLQVIADNRGNFTIDLPLNEYKFATLQRGGRAYTLLLIPGKKLQLIFGSDTTVLFKGTAGAQNRLLASLHLGDIPFFGKEIRAKNPYAHLSAAGVADSVFKPWFAIRDERLKGIKESSLTHFEKQLISQEVEADAVVQAHSYLRGIGSFRMRELIGLTAELYKGVSITPEVMPAGPQFYRMADNYVGHMEGQAILEMQTLKENANKTPLKFYNISLDSGNVLIDKKGKMFLNWIAIRNNYPADVAEALLAQAVFSKTVDKDLAQAAPLMEELMYIYPGSRYIGKLSARMNMLKAALKRNSANRAIHIFNESDSINSVAALLARFKGKVVYLDIWGTWCGPCKDELRYVPELRKRFEGKDVAFVYIDMDEDKKDAQWREFLIVNNMEGWHLRKSRKDINPFWEELLPAFEGRNSYPTYFIFDRSGKLVIPKAKRPSDKAELYRQIDGFL